MVPPPSRAPMARACLGKVLGNSRWGQGQVNTSRLQLALTGALSLASCPPWHSPEVRGAPMPSTKSVSDPSP